MRSTGAVQMNADVVELLNYNNGFHCTHLAEAKTSYWHERPAMCGRTYPNRESLVTDDEGKVDCPGCLRAVAAPAPGVAR